ncbi:MAG: acyl-CoA dehydrogenase protein [Betaproteobacteria bacterium]|nr:acyl-CoA dehydrogenase protein [Betaproteobacteria bacterium]
MQAIAEEDRLFNLQLSPEQLEFRDTVRDFVQNEVKPAALQPARLEPFEKPLLLDQLDAASRMGLRTLSLSEAAGGAGADTLTSCIVLEELGVGDVDLAAVLGTTALLGAELFDAHQNAALRGRFLPAFLEDRGHHIAFAAHDYTAQRGWNYHRAYAEESTVEPRAAKQTNGDWIIDGDAPSVANAPVAKLFVVQVRTDAKKIGANGLTTLLVPRSSIGLRVEERAHNGHASEDEEETIPWQHGSSAAVEFRSCRVPGDHLLGKESQSTFSSRYMARATVQLAAINLGVGRAAYEAAIDYAKMRIQGGRPIIQHQSIGAILADVAIKLEVARSMIWKAAWALDHPEAVSDRSVSDLPLHTIARVYTAEAMHEATLDAAECFGAMGVMRDMPMQKYVHDALVLLHSADQDCATKLQIAEALAGYERNAAA